MKKIFLALLSCIITMASLAQDRVGPPTRQTRKKGPLVRPNKCPSVYLSTSSGLNNNTGLIGFSFDVPIDKYLSVEAGAGISSWGEKIFVGGKYYLQPCQRGWAFGTGITYNTGLQGYQADMETIYNGGPTETVQLNLHPQTNILFAAYRYWNLGKHYNRFYIELGWSVPLTGGNKYEQVYGDPLSPRANTTINLLSPGGLIAAAGFSFGVH